MTQTKDKGDELFFKIMFPFLFPFIIFICIVYAMGMTFRDIWKDVFN